MIIIRCENCKAKLNPYMLKQAGYVNNELTFEVECIKCREYNTLSIKGYFHLKKDYKMPKMRPINVKLPSDLNIMIVSMERCGISFVVRELSMLHKRMFGVPIILNAEQISPVQATRTRFPVYKGWYNVYDVNPLDLLKTKDNGEKYDRVLIVKRKWKTIRTVHEIFYPDELGEDQKVKWREKDKEMYEKVYNQEIDDPRCLTVNLEDCNNYTVDTFNELMDFFNFPEHIQPIIAPILAPERNSEAYSSILKKGQPLIKRLETIASFYELTLDGLLQLKNEKQRLFENKLKNIIPKNILIIGPGFNIGCHFSENIYYAFKERGYNVELLGIENIDGGRFALNNKLYETRELLYPLSKALKCIKMKTPNLVVIDEPHWLFYNDLNIPVFYIHREFKRPPKVFYPDIAFFWHEGVKDYFKRIFAPHWIANIPKLDIMPIAVDINVYKPRKKEIKGIVLLGGRESFKDIIISVRELTNLGMVHLIIKEIQEYIDLGLPFIADEDGTLTDERFRELLPQCEAIWVHLPRGQYTTRRMLEAMACKTLCFIILDNKEHERTLRSMGFVPNVHYILINEIEDLKERSTHFKYSTHKNIVDAAYKEVTENHTYLNRADRLIEFYKEYALRYKGLIVE